MSAKFMSQAVMRVTIVERDDFGRSTDDRCSVTEQLPRRKVRMQRFQLELDVPQRGCERD
jgi:hypothetical protein